MATLGTNKYDFTDVARRLDPDGKIALVAEMMEEINLIIPDVPWIEGNLPTGTRLTRRTSLPSVGFRRINSGVDQSKSTTEQVDDVCGMLEAYADVDKKLADLNGNTNQFRLSESVAYLEAMNQKYVDTLIYGNVTTTPEAFQGFFTRDYYSDTGSEYFIDAGGTGSDNTSILLVGWSPNKIYGIYPKASKAGLSTEDKGQVTLYDSSNRPYEGYRMHYVWECGLAVKDYRYAVRIGNIDVSALKTYGASTGDESPDITGMLIEAYNLIPHIDMCQPRIYCNKTVKTELDKMANDTGNRNVSVNVMDGKPVTNFWGIPVKKVDAILDNEEVVS